MMDSESNKDDGDGDGGDAVTMPPMTMIAVVMTGQVMKVMTERAPE